ncbi:MAG: 30S ribosomal protein S12 methylthiotransferase RimO [Sorangiineae bacterium]|nr:30S ribosomal protein S12 methylthiotransferase RimO [Polyangiaceae bacterium]MEB2323819.1 30S ribosomal protein S12 methylthiotransferase RimO [Sorangiineae bacterium]
MSRTIHFVSLGCPKNRVDTEVMLGVAERAGYQHLDDPKEALVLVVNTCGFIDAAKKESIDTILELAEYKKTGRCEKLVVAGCLSQRYPGELAEGLPEVDHFLGSSDMLTLAHVLAGDAARMLVGNPADWVVGASDPRRVSTRGGSAYVKLAEGCNRSCSFCVIPAIRGKQRSRAADDIVREVERLAEAGVLEVNLVSQDTVAYGRDRPEGGSLAEVVQRIAEVPGLAWVRLHYLYPETLDPALIELLAHHPRVLPYVDMPLQHAADAMLRRMRRGHGGARLRQVVERLRREIPGLVMRTAFIVGHPGETAAEFDELVDFVRWAEFDRMGVFRFSDEPGARSHELEGKVPGKIAAARVSQLMRVQKAISRKKNRALIGRELEVLVEGPSAESELVMVGRHAGQAPEIDGVVYLSNGEVEPGRMVRVVVSQASDYDLVGEVVSEDRAPAGAPGAHRASADASGRRRVSLRTL